MLVSSHMHARMHSKPKHAYNFQMSLVAILKLFLTKNEKNWGHIQIGFDEMKLFQSHNHFIFSQEKLQNGHWNIFSHFFAQIFTKSYWNWVGSSPNFQDWLCKCLHACTAAVWSRASRVLARGPHPSPPQGLGFFGA